MKIYFYERGGSAQGIAAVAALELFALVVGKPNPESKVNAPLLATNFFPNSFGNV